MTNFQFRISVLVAAWRVASSRFAFFALNLPASDHLRQISRDCKLSSQTPSNWVKPVYWIKLPGNSMQIIYHELLAC